jgi:hypothetical protein
MITVITVWKAAPRNQQARAGAKSAMGDEALADVLQRGSTLTQDDAIAYILTESTG